MTSPVASLYRIFNAGDDGAPAMRPIIIAMVALALVVGFAGIVRVSRQHEVLRLGAELSRMAERVRALKETNRELSLERATLTRPERIRGLATELGMTTVAPDRIRVIVTPKVSAL